MKTTFTPILGKLAAIALFGLVFASCQKDEVIPQAKVSTGVLIANQGQFFKNNASVSLLNLSSNTLSLDVYASANSEQLGDIAQSMTKIGSKIYVVVNNSGKVTVLNDSTFKKEGEISGLTSPRYLVEAASGKAYVSDLFSNKIAVVNLSTNTVLKTIDCIGWTEEMASKDGKTYVCNVNSEYLYVINHSSDAISDSILVGKGAQSLSFDSNGKLWLAFGQLYDANFNPIENGKIKSVNIGSKTIEFNKTVSNGGASFIRMNTAKNTFFYLNGGAAYQLTTNASELPSSAYFSSTTASYGALGYDANKEELYLANQLDFVNAGTVTRVGTTKEIISTYTVGVVPGEFLFLSK